QRSLSLVSLGGTIGWRSAFSSKGLSLASRLRHQLVQSECSVFGARSPPGDRLGWRPGLGAATADAIYGCVAGFGLTAISIFLVAQGFWLGLLGGLFLCYLGICTFFARPAEDPADLRKGGLLSSYLSTFLLTLTNPMTILSFVAIFAGLGLGTSPDYFN